MAALPVGVKGTIGDLLKLVNGNESRDEKKRLNFMIRNQSLNIYKKIIDEVDPNYVLDHLIQKRVIGLQRKQSVMGRVTKRDQCRALLDQLLLCSNDKAFIFLRESLEDHYPWIVEQIDNGKIEETVEEGPDEGPTEELQNKILRKNENKLTSMKNDMPTKVPDSTKNGFERSKGIDAVSACKPTFQEPAQVIYVANLQQKITELESLLDKANEREKQHLQQISSLEDRLKTALAVKEVDHDRVDSDLNHRQGKIFTSAQQPLNAACQGGRPQPSLRSPNMYANASQGVNVPAARPPPPPRNKPSDDGYANANESARPRPPPRRTDTRDQLNFDDPDVTDTESALLTKPLLSGVIKGDVEVRGIAMLDNQLYVIRFESDVLEIYDAIDGFKRNRRSIVIAQSGETVKTGFMTVPVSSGFQDMASCNQMKRLYLCDSQNCDILCLDPGKKEVEHRWCVEDGDPLGISVTFESNIVVSLQKLAGALCVYSNKGLLIHKIVFEDLLVQDEPWHAVQMDANCWVVCHGSRYDGGEGFITAIDSDGIMHGDYTEVEFGSTPTHLALLPNGRLLAVVGERNCVVLLERLFCGEVREILNPDHCMAMPVRIHYCRDSGQLIVGLIDGTVIIYRIMAS